MFIVVYKRSFVFSDCLLFVFGSKIKPSSAYCSTRQIKSVESGSKGAGGCLPLTLRGSNILKKDWSTKDIDLLIRYKKDGMTDHQISQKLKRSYDSINSKISRLKSSGELSKSFVPRSTQPIFDGALKTQGDAVILSDVEAPFQESEFINRVLDLADSWGIRTLHLAGDLMHYDRLSMWGAEWQPDERFQQLQDFLINNLSNRQRQAGIDLIDGLSEQGGYSDEMKEARNVFKNLNSFDEIIVAIGNHDDRYLRTLSVGMRPMELLIQMGVSEDKRWKIAPYYYSLIETEKGLYRIEHPRGAGQKAAVDLAIQHHCHVIMGHSHRWAVNLDPSGDYWAIQQGHCVDENRLAYVMQRGAKRDAHRLGATIIRDGFPFVLNSDTPWNLLKRM